MKLQFVSDLHLEFPENHAYLAEHPLEVKGDILLVAGDTAYLDLPGHTCMHLLCGGDIFQQKYYRYP